MNYFELFELPLRFRVDQQELKKKYMQLSRKYHPDFFVQAPAAEQARVLEMSSLLNKGLKTLQDPDATMRYVLTLKGLIDGEEKHTLDPEFLMEVMELNEELMEAEESPVGDGNTKVAGKILALENKLHEDVAQILEQYEEGVTPQEAMLQVKEYYYRKKYLSRMRERIKEGG